MDEATAYHTSMPVQVPATVLVVWLLDNVRGKARAPGTHVEDQIRVLGSWL